LRGNPCHGLRTEISLTLVAFVQKRKEFGTGAKVFGHDRHAEMLPPAVGAAYARRATTGRCGEKAAVATVRRIGAGS
jgi:hypothetical protein